MNGDYFSNPMFPTMENDFNDIDLSKKEISNIKNMVNKKVIIHVSLPQANDNNTNLEGVLKDYEDDYITVFDEKNNTWLWIYKKYICYVESQEN